MKWHQIRKQVISRKMLTGNNNDKETQIAVVICVSFWYNIAIHSGAKMNTGRYYSQSGNNKRKPESLLSSLRILLSDYGGLIKCMR